MSNPTSTTTPEEEEPKVILEQTLLKTEEVFVYRIPPMMTAGGHNASNWDLANPAATCSLHVLRRDSSLLIKLLADKPKVNGPPGATEKYLFAQSTITLDFSTASSSDTGNSVGNNTSTTLPSSSSSSSSKPEMKLSMSHWIEAVVDSSRYFVIRISDEKRKKEAHVGMGFRERSDALNFKMSLQDYENTMRKEAMVAFSSSGDDESHNIGNDDEEKQNDNDVDDSESNQNVEAAVSKLSLKEGEKIHINLKGSSTKSRPKKVPSTSSSTTPNSKPPTLLRKPPPAATSSSAAAASTRATPTKSSIVIDTASLSLSNSKEFGSRSRDVSSVAAVAETMELDDEDEWGDFESPSFEQQQQEEE